MLFHLTSDDHIRIMNEQGPETNDAGTTFTSEQGLQELAKEWPMKRGDLEPLAGSARSGSVYRSQDRGRTDLASHSSPNRSRSSEHAARFENATPAGISRGLESGTGFNTVMPAGRRHAERDPKPNRVAGPYGAWVHLAQPVQAKPKSALL